MTPALTSCHFRIISLVVIAAMSAAIIFQLVKLGGPQSYDMAGIKTWLQSIPLWIFCGVFFLAPLLGSPMSPLVIAMGLILPLPIAIALTFLTLLLHHLLVFSLKQSPIFQKFQMKLHEKKLLRLREGHRSLSDDALLILAATWVPGISYIFKIALTSIAGIKFKRYFIIGCLSQLSAALPFLLMGELINQGRFWWIGLLLFVLIVFTWLLKSAYNKRKTIELT